MLKAIRLRRIIIINNIMNKYKLNGIILIINPALFIAGTSKVISALSPIFYMVFFKFGKIKRMRGWLFNYYWLLYD